MSREQNLPLGMWVRGVQREEAVGSPVVNTRSVIVNGALRAWADFPVQNKLDQLLAAQTWSNGG